MDTRFYYLEYVCMCTYMCVYVYIYVYIYIYMCVCVCFGICVCVCICVYVCVCSIICLFNHYLYTIPFVSYFIVFIAVFNLVLAGSGLTQ